MGPWMTSVKSAGTISPHDDVIKWKHFPRYWPFARGIHRWPVNSPHKGQWREALMFSLICAWQKGWVNNREAGDWDAIVPIYDVTVVNLHITTKGNHVHFLWMCPKQCIPNVKMYLCMRIVISLSTFLIWLDTCLPAFINYRQKRAMPC